MMLLAADPMLEIQPNSKAYIHLIATLVSCSHLGQSPLFAMECTEGNTVGWVLASNFQWAASS